MTGEGELGLYVHWPYCARICPYCDFNVYRVEDEAGALLDSIIADLKAHRALLGPRRLSTLFLGGGTPSLMNADAVARLIDAAADAFGFVAAPEITLEANPEDRGRFADFVAAGIDRLSLGVQALRDDALKALGRKHDSAQARMAVEVAAATGARVSLDLIYARIGQDAADWELELAEALRLPAEHYSLYQLSIEPETPFGRAAARSLLTPRTAEEGADFFEATQAQAAAAGAAAYEISNYARRAAARSRHNLLYWRNAEWIGVGPGAHGRLHFEGRRNAVAAIRSPADYVAQVAAKGLGWEEVEALDASAQADEVLLMGLRLAEGVSRARVEALRGKRLAVESLVAEGLLENDPSLLRLTPAGRLLADRVALELSAS